MRIYFFFFLKNDAWKPAAQFITYEFEQLVCLPFTPCGWSLTDSILLRHYNEG